jgi:hypothetical protein
MAKESRDPFNRVPTNFSWTRERCTQRGSVWKPRTGSLGNIGEQAGGSVLPHEPGPAESNSWLKGLDGDSEQRQVAVSSAQKLRKDETMFRQRKHHDLSEEMKSHLQLEADKAARVGPKREGS